MTQERVALLVRQATEGLPQESEVAVIREGAWFQQGEAKARIVIGRSRGGYHLGLCVVNPPHEQSFAWSEALPSLSHALSAGEAAMDRWFEIMETEQ
jgi:hypothetical protein